MTELEGRLGTPGSSLVSPIAPTRRPGRPHPIEPATRHRHLHKAFTEAADRFTAKKSCGASSAPFTPIGGRQRPNHARGFAYRYPRVATVGIVI